MPKPADPSKTYFGKPCEKHPELGGERRLSSRQCAQCCRDSSIRNADRMREKAGKQRAVRYTPEEAKERIRLRDLERNRKRRAMADYNARQIERKRKWRAANPERFREASRAYDRLQMATNLQRRVSKNLRHRLSKALLGKTRGASAVRDLGMSIADFRTFFESKFKPGMSWENYGKWHIDHIRPLASFDLTDPEQAKAACHYSNLQPLWALENQRKWKHSPEACEVVA